MSGTVQNVPSLEIQSGALQSQVKTEGYSTPSVTITSSEVLRTTTPIVTGTGSITATPTAYTTAVTTLAASTTTTTTGQETVLGKRIRRTSTKYDDFEQPLMVSFFLFCFTNFSLFF